MDKKMLEKIYKMSQKQVKNYVKQKLEKIYDSVICRDGFVFAKGTFPVLLVAHMDTVHVNPVKTIVYSNNGDVISSPQGIGGDDRNGIYMILEVIKRHKCSVLFCEDEEIGCIGSGKFADSDLVKDLEFNYIIEFDRANANDAVFYSCANDEFEEFITKEFYKTAYGSFTDICEIAPALGCAAVNLSCGYYKAHTTKEYVVLSEMERSIKEACKLLDRTTENDKFEYIEEIYTGYNFGWCGNYDMGMENEYNYGDNYYLIEYVDARGDTQWYDTIAVSKAEAIGKFVMEFPDIAFADVIDVCSQENAYSYF